MTSVGGDWIWVTSVPGLSLSGSLGLLDAEITGALETIGNESLKGRDSGNALNYSGNIALNWETALSDALTLRVLAAAGARLRVAESVRRSPNVSSP